MKEILVHLSAPTSHKDDEKYRKLAEAYDDFEPATITHCTAGAGNASDVNVKSSRTPRSLQHVVPGTPANFAAFRSRPSHPGVTAEIHSAQLTGETPQVKETPVTAGFVEPAQIVPASRSAAKGKKLELYAQAPDFGSFTSTTTSRTPMQQLHELEQHYLQQSRSSTKRAAPSLSDRNTPRKGHWPLFIENTQEAPASLEDHVESSFGSWPSSSPIESPITQGPSKRACLSVDIQSPEVSRASQHAGAPTAETPRAPGAWIPPPRTPPRDSMSSQMPDHYYSSDSQPSSRRTSGSQDPVFADKAGLREDLNAVSDDNGRNNSSVCMRHLFIGQMQPGQRTTQASPNSQTSTRDVSELPDIEPTGVGHMRPSQTSTQDLSDHVHPNTQSGDPPRVNQDTSLLKQKTNSTTALSDKIPQPQESDFASLPLQLLPKQPNAEKKRKFNEVTSMMGLYVEKASIAKHYKPAVVSRAFGAGERGCWMFDTSNWKSERQYEFWTRMQYLLEAGYFGNIWLQRNVSKDGKDDRGDGNEANGLGVVWLFCWGQVVPHIWVVLLVESNREIRKSKARWTVGSMENLEVVVQMP